MKPNFDLDLRVAEAIRLIHKLHWRKWAMHDFHPSSKPEHLWPLIRDYASDINEYIVMKANHGEGYADVYDFWSSICEETFLKKLCEMLEDNSDG